MLLNLNEDPIAKRKIELITNGMSHAEADHTLALELGKNLNESMIAFRRHVVNVCLDKSYMDMQVTLESGIIQTFGTFTEWLEYVCDSSGITATARSGLKNFIYRIALPVEAGEIYDVQLDSVLLIPERNMQRAASAAGKIAKEDPNYEDQMYQLIRAAQTMGASDFEAYIKASQLAKDKPPKDRAVMITREQSVGIFIPIEDEELYHKVTMALKHVCYVVQTDPESLMEEIRGSFMGTDPEPEAEDSEY